MSDLACIEAENLLDDTSATEEALHASPGDVVLAEHLHAGAEDVGNWIRRDAEVLDFIEIGGLQFTDRRLSRINLRLHVAQLMLDLYLPLIDRPGVFCAVFR